MLPPAYPMIFRVRTCERLLLAALVLAISLFARPASAQVAGAGATITVVNEASLVRTDANGNTIQKRPLTLNPEAVNFQDCVDNQNILFTLQETGFEANAQIQQWASNGGDCTQQTARSGGVQTCWQLGSNIALQPTVTVSIPVRKIMSGAIPNSPTAPNDSASVCGTVDLSTISVQFLYFSPGQPATAASNQTVSVIVDTVGPDPPTGLSALPGNTRIAVSWNNISGGAAVDDAGSQSTGGTGGGLTALTGVNVFCDPAQGGATPTPGTPVCTTVPNVVDAGPDADASTEDAGTTQVCTDGGSPTSSSECGSVNLSTSDGGKIQPTTDFINKFGCGSITGNTGNQVVAGSVGGQPLVNGTRYAVAVAATDAYGNLGPLSDVVCETPAPTTDFWNTYKQDGGDAGGGCAVGPADLPLGTLSVLATIAALGASSLRRRRRKT
jgi:hypothetical protein